jgi:phosphohistidine swiveling domain-containing protein
VVSSLPLADGQTRGAVAIQPFLVNPTAGITFFDGFYFEETVISGQNRAVTSGHLRGEVQRGHLARGEPVSEWLCRIHRLFGGTLDLEWSESSDGERVLLQVRPALFPIRRCETLSLANNQETLGRVPSPWITGVYRELGNPVLELARRADTGLPEWKDSYAIKLAGRSWVNFSSLFRLMDRWGLPRNLVCRTLGGASANESDDGFLRMPFVRSLPTLVKMAWICLETDFAAGKELRRLDESIAEARSLLELWKVNVDTHRVSVRTNFALIAIATTASGLRRRFGLPSKLHSITQCMMNEYSELAALPRLADRMHGLDKWLDRYGHRGPHETDPSQPRFTELESTLRQDLARATSGTTTNRTTDHTPSRVSIARLLGYWEERREWFRDALMRHTQQLRSRILEEAQKAVCLGFLDQAEDIFCLDHDDLVASQVSWKKRARLSRVHWERNAHLILPTTATRDVIDAAVAGSTDRESGPGESRFKGIGLGSRSVTGTVVKARAIHELVRRRNWPESAILVVDALEPSWAVVYPRFGAVVSQLGGELSHAAILLREAEIPSVINAAGAFEGLDDGDRVLVDPTRGEVLRLSRSRSSLKRVSVPQRSHQ